ncbi:MAG: helix-turn-helix domain-containing protein [Thermoplasmata archaeon]
MTSLLVEFRVASDPCPLVRLTSEFEDVEVEYLDMARTSGDAFLEVFEVRGPRAEAFRDTLMTADGISDVQVREEAPDRQVCQGVIALPCIRTLLARQGWMPSKVVAAGGLETISVSVGDLDEARDLVNFAQANYPTFELSRITSQGALPIVSGRDAWAVSLTARQEEVLRRAISEGYFDARRRKSAKEIAGGMGIDRSTFARHLRAAMKKVVSNLFG